MEISEKGGFTLMEVLVSLFVLSLGVIGAAGMQLAALRTTQQSSFQTTALELASEMAEKMRANDSRMKQSDSSNPFLGIDYQSAGGAESAAPAIMCYGKGADCDAAALASFDIYEWEKRIKAALPSGRAVICRDTNPWDGTAGSLNWNCDGGSDASIIIKIGWQGKNPDGSLIADTGKQFPPSVALTIEPYTR